jgi:hypothetical protein
MVASSSGVSYVRLVGEGWVSLVGAFTTRRVFLAAIAAIKIAPTEREVLGNHERHPALPEGAD